MSSFFTGSVLILPTREMDAFFPGQRCFNNIFAAAPPHAPCDEPAPCICADGSPDPSDREAKQGEMRRWATIQTDGRTATAIWWLSQSHLRRFPFIFRFLAFGCLPCIFGAVPHALWRTRWRMKMLLG